jgi:O-antigen ligase
VATTLVGVVLAYVLSTVSFQLALVFFVCSLVVVSVFAKPILGLLLIVFSVPMEDYFFVPGLPFSLMKMVGLLALASTVVHMLAFARRSLIGHTLQDRILLIFVVATLISGLLGIDPIVTLRNVSRLIRVLIVYFIALYVVESPRALRAVLWTMCIAGLMSSLVGIYDFYAWRATHIHDLRISGTMDNTNEFAATMVLIAVIAYHLMRDEANLLRCWLLALIAGTLLFAAMLTASRGAVLALGASALLVVLSQRHRRLQTLLALVVLAALILLVMPPSVRERLGMSSAGATYVDDMTTSSRAASTKRRLSYQVLGVRTFFDRPITGIGLGGFGVAYDRSEFRWLSEQNGDGVRARVAHNMFLEILVGTGILGALPFLGILYLTLRDYARVRKEAAGDSFLSLTSQGLFIGFAALLMSSFFLSAQYGKYLWLLVALAPVTAHLAKLGGAQE